ncbi:MAG: type II toxin-antitoxin system VapC family toxin [Phormidesmis sp.]|mgnify:FL=1
MIIVDTGVFVALFDKSDTHHSRVKGFFARLQEPLITTLPVITETCYLLNQYNKCNFLKTIDAGAVELFALKPHHFKRVLALSEQYADLPIDFADASLIVLAEALCHGRIITVDRRDFSVYRWANSQTFDNLLF